MTWLEDHLVYLERQVTLAEDAVRMIDAGLLASRTRTIGTDWVDTTAADRARNLTHIEQLKPLIETVKQRIADLP